MIGLDNGVVVCLKCKGRNVSYLKHDEAWLEKFGASMGVVKCADCGHVGVPLVLGSECEYEKLLQTLKSEGDNPD